MPVSRRSLIVGAGLAAAATPIVRAESLLHLPGDPLTARGLFAAAKFASQELCELPASRIVFADGDATRWGWYQCMSRGPVGTPIEARRNFAVAIEVCVADETGQHFITSVPFNGEQMARRLLNNSSAQKQLQHEANQRARSVMMQTLRQMANAEATF